MMIPDIPRAPPTLTQQLRDLGWPPPAPPHIPPRPTRDPGTRPLPTIAEAMAALGTR